MLNFLLPKVLLGHEGFIVQKNGFYCSESESEHAILIHQTSFSRVKKTKNLMFRDTDENKTLPFQSASHLGDDPLAIFSACLMWQPQVLIAYRSGVVDLLLMSELGEWENFNVVCFNFFVFAQIFARFWLSLFNYTSFFVWWCVNSHSENQLPCRNRMIHSPVRK